MKKLIAIILLVGCNKQKEIQFIPGDLELINVEKNEQARKGNPNNPNTTIHKACWLLDFDGYYVPAGVWGAGFYVSGSGNVNQSQIVSTVKNYWSRFDVEITTNEIVYNSYPINKRMRVVITTTNFYGNYGGVAYINSLSWIDQEKQCFVFSSLLGYNAKYISDASAHEMGHTANCYHHKAIVRYTDGCYIAGEYLQSNHIMGNPYYFSNPIFTTGETDCNLTTNDITNINTAIQ